MQFSGSHAAVHIPNGWSSRPHLTLLSGGTRWAFHLCLSQLTWCLLACSHTIVVSRIRTARQCLEQVTPACKQQAGTQRCSTSQHELQAGIANAVQQSVRSPRGQVEADNPERGLPAQKLFGFAHALPIHLKRAERLSGRLTRAERSFRKA